jgi:hypothetical protein
MSAAFGRDALLEAFDQIGHGAALAGTIVNLMQVAGISTVDEAIALLGRYFPVSAASSEKQRFLLQYMNRAGGADAPKYPR